MKNAMEIIHKLEAHCGTTIQDDRLRFHIIQALDREMDKFNGLRLKLSLLLEIPNPQIIDGDTHKPMRKRDVKS